MGRRFAEGNARTDLAVQVRMPRLLFRWVSETCQKEGLKRGPWIRHLIATARQKAIEEQLAKKTGT